MIGMPSPYTPHGGEGVPLGVSACVLAGTVAYQDLSGRAAEVSEPVVLKDALRTPPTRR